MTATPETADHGRNDWLAQAEILSRALPYMRRYSGAAIVVKYGGNAMDKVDLAHLFARDMVLLRQVGMIPVVVHGGGPQIGQMLDRLNIRSAFIDGLRVTDAATMEVVEMVLSGTINKRIVAAINEAGGFAVGLSGKDGNLIVGEKLRRLRKDPVTGDETPVDLGLVGEPAAINPHVLQCMLAAGSDIIPVIAPVAFSKQGETLNVNADTAAGAIAGALEARRLLMLTDVPGVLDRNGQIIPRMTAGEARQAIADGTIGGGMIPKVETCLAAVEAGVEGAVIIDGRVPHAVLLELFTEHGVGTLIERSA